jgi:centrin-1
MNEEIRDLFDQFDVDGSGDITDIELLKALKSCGLNIDLTGVRDMIKQVDRNGDGSLDFDEFYILMMPMLKEELFRQEDQLEDLRALFRESDIDRTGYLTVNEIL